MSHVHLLNPFLFQILSCGFMIIIVIHALKIINFIIIQLLVNGMVVVSASDAYTYHLAFYQFQEYNFS